jgi:uncharacterized protein with HEPN domain
VSRTDQELVREALEHLAVLRRHLERGDLADETVADAVSLRLAASIESLSRTSDRLRLRAFGTMWPAMWATRNRIAHGYAHIALEIIEQTVSLDLPALEERLRAQLE